MSMQRWFWTCAAILPLVALPAYAADLSPGVQEAIRGLSAESFQSREKASKAFELELNQQLQSLLSRGDGKGQSRVGELLEFNLGATRWALETLKLPEEQRNRQLKWGVNPNVLPVLANIVSPVAAKRAEGIRQLAKYGDDEASFVFARPLDDPDRSVRLAAMEAHWDRPASAAAVSSLWNRAVESGLAIGEPEFTNNGRLDFDKFLSRTQDGDVAAEVLIHLNSPLITEAFKGLLARAAQEFGRENADPERTEKYLGASQYMQNAFRIAVQGKQRELLPALYDFATAPCRIKAGENGSFYSNRTEALGALLELAAQPPRDYGLKKGNAGRMWTTRTEADEDAAVAKVKVWWAGDGQKIDAAKDAASAAPTSQPAAKALLAREVLNQDAPAVSLGEAIKALSADDPQTAEKASLQIRATLCAQLAALVSFRDPEVLSRIVTLLENHASLTRWAIDTLKLPDDRRLPQLKWGMSPNLLPIVSGAFSPDPDARAPALAELAKLEDGEASVLLASLIEDSDRPTCLAAMEAAAERKPSDAVIAALWNRGIQFGLDRPPASQLKGAKITFRGRLIADYDENALKSVSRRKDADRAVEILDRLKSPQVAAKLKALLEKADQHFSADPVDRRQAFTYLGTTDSMHDAYALAEGYPKELSPILYKIATGPCVASQVIKLPAKNVFCSNRTAALEALVHMTQQSLEEYKLEKFPLGARGLWTSPTEADENAAVEKLKVWWKENPTKQR